jgi:integrase
VQKLTKRVVESVTPDLRRIVHVWDGEVRGFGVRVFPSGRRVYVLKYRSGTRQRWLRLGDHGDVTTEQARSLAQKRLGQVADGRDPAAEIRNARDEREQREAEAKRAHDLAALAPNMEAFATRYLERHAGVRKKPSSIRGDRWLLTRHVTPALGRLKVEHVTRAHVTALHDSMKATPHAANRARALLSKMMNLAEKWGLRPDGSNPCRHVERYAETKRRRFLSDEELARLGATLDAAEREGLELPAVVAALRLLVLTGARMGEVLSLRWEQVDRARGVLRLADSKTGAKEIPLGNAALDVLDGIARTTSPWVIAGREHGRPFVNLNKAWRRIRTRAGLEDVRVHDLRRTAASAGASAGLSLETVGQLLGHTQAATTKRYAFLFDDEKRAAAETMSARVAQGLRGKPGADVVPLRR